MKSTTAGYVAALGALVRQAAGIYIQPVEDPNVLARSAFQYDSPNITAATFNGGYASAGVYYDGPPGKLQTGTILTTGFATGANTGQDKSVNHGLGSSGLCGALLGKDEAALTFTFSSSPKFAAYSFNFMFATEEYQG
jgi:hypothetical protein